MSCSRWKRRRRNHTSSLGNSYFVISPRPVGYFTFMYRNAMFFASITTSQYAKALPQSALVVLGHTPCVFRSIAQIGGPGHWVGYHPRDNCVSREALPHTFHTRHIASSVESADLCEYLPAFSGVPAKGRGSTEWKTTWSRSYLPVPSPPFPLNNYDRTPQRPPNAGKKWT